MSYYIENHTWIPLQSSKASIDRKLDRVHDTFPTDTENKYKLHKAIKDDNVTQDAAILPKIFDKKYKEITELINKDITKNNIELINKLLSQKKELEGIYRALDDNKLDKLTDTFKPDKDMFENNSNSNIVSNPLNKIIQNWTFDSKNLYESTYTYLWDKLFSKGVGLEDYGCKGSPSGSRMLEKGKFELEPSDPTDKSKKKPVGFQKNYMEVCSEFLSSLNNIICLQSY